MSEKVYRFLLRFYPSRFRRQYGEEAMQVLRDRLRDERGVLRRMRLWMDLLRDLTVSAPREYRRTARPVQTTSGVPSFMVLEEEPLRPDMFLLGTVLALVALGTFGYLLTHGGNRVLLPAVFNPLQSAEAPVADASGAQERSAPSEGGEAIPVPLVTAAERRLVIRKVIDAVEQGDTDRAEARDVAAMLEQREGSGEYNRIRSGPLFAVLLTREINAVTRQVTVTVFCGQQPLPESGIWAVPSHPGQRAWRRIDDHFSVGVRQGTGDRSR